MAPTLPWAIARAVADAAVAVDVDVVVDFLLSTDRGSFFPHAPCLDVPEAASCLSKGCTLSQPRVRR